MAAFSRFCFYLECFVDSSVRLLSFVLVPIVFVLVFLVAQTYFTEIVPVLTKNHGVLLSSALSCVGIFFLINVVFNYVCIIAFGPGHPPEQLSDAQVEKISQDPTMHVNQNQRYCDRCRVIKPMRAHHDSVTRACALKMDHYCVWTMTTIGWRNHRYFLLFLLYVLLGCSFVALTGMERFHGGPRSRSSSTALFAYMLSWGMGIAMACFFAWSLFLICGNKTSVEFYSSLDRTQKYIHQGYAYPFDLGVKRNLEQFFWPDVPKWKWIMPSLRAPPGDGLIFPFVLRRPNTPIEDSMIIWPQAPVSDVDMSSSLLTASSSSSASASAASASTMDSGSGGAVLNV